MTRAIQKTPRSDELLRFLLTHAANLTLIDDHLRLEQYSEDDVSRAGYDYADECWSDCLDYFDKCSDEECCSDSVFIPNILSSNMPQVFDLLLRYGLNPNAVCDGDALLNCVMQVYNEYVAADTLALLIEHGGDPDIVFDGTNLMSAIITDICFDAFEQENRRIYDAMVHCLLVLLGYGAKIQNAASLDVYARRRSECSLPEFRLEDLKHHRDYDYGLSNACGHGDNWSLHIFDKRTRWEVVRL